MLKAYEVSPTDAGVLDSMARYGIQAPPPKVVAPPPAPPPMPAARPGGSQAPAAPMPSLSRALPRGSPAAPGSRPPALVRDGPPVDLSALGGGGAHPARLGPGAGMTFSIFVLLLVLLGGWALYSRYQNARDREVTKLLKQTKDQLAKDDYEGYQEAERRPSASSISTPYQLRGDAYVAYIDALRFGENGEGSDYLSGRRAPFAKASSRPTPRSRACGTTRSARRGYSEELSLDLSTVVPSIAGPKRPQDRIEVADAKTAFRDALPSYVPEHQPRQRAAGTFPALTRWPRVTVPGPRTRSRYAGGRHHDHVDHGSVVIAAITSCTNTCNPWSWSAPPCWPGTRSIGA